MSLRSTLVETADDVVDTISSFGRGAGGKRLVCVAESDALAVYGAFRGNTARISDAALAARKPSERRGELRLPSSLVLSQTLSLPAATEGFVEPVLDHRLDKLTPWAPDRVVYGYRVLGKEDDGSLSVQFAATALDIADIWVSRATAIGFTPTAIGSAAAPLAEPLAIDLWRGARDARRGSRRRMLAVAAAIAVVLPVASFAASLFATTSSSDRLHAIEARSAALRVALMPASGGDSREAALIGSKRPETAMMTIIDRLGSALPDGTSLRELEIDPDRLRISGTSEAAPELLSLLDKSGVFASPRFSAPVTRNADGRDGFEILASRVAPSPEPGGRP